MNSAQANPLIERQFPVLSESEPLPAFDFQPQTRVIFGAGCLERVGELSRELKGNRIFLVTDKGLKDAGHEDRCLESLQAAGLDVTVYDDVHSNPTTEDVGQALETARAADVNLIVGLGGGSSMDCAKGANFLLTNGGRIEDYWGIGKAAKPMLPMIAIPTTAGTGSEAQSFALIAKTDTHMKMACGDKKAACRIAILDPELTVTMPASVTAATGIDAVSHAIETYVTKPRNPISQLFGKRAWRMLSQGFPRVLKDPNSIEDRGAMLLGAHLAGAAIENSMLGATHALANPLSAHYDMTHGIAIGIMLPHVIRYNSETVSDLYDELALEAGLGSSSDENSSDLLADFVRWMVAESGSPTSLSECNVDPNLFDQMSQEAAAQWTGNFNPRPVDADSLKELYECATDG